LEIKRNACKVDLKNTGHPIYTGGNAMSRLRFLALGILLLFFAGCFKKNSQTTEQPPQQQAVQPPAVQPAPSQPVSENAPQISQPEAPQPVTAPPAQEPATAQVKPEKKAPPQKTQAQKPAPATSAASERKASTPPSTPAASTIPPARDVEPPAPPKPRFATIPSGTSLQVRLQSPLDSGVNKSGETFQAILDRDLEVDGQVVATRGSLVEGKLSKVVQSGRVEGRAEMSLQLLSLAISSQTYPIQTAILSFQAESTKKQDATKVGIGAGLGAVIGAIAGGGKGAAIGAAVGAGAGGATVVATRGKEIKFDAEHKFTFALTHDISVKLQ
jgi:hypothetical protein